MPIRLCAILLAARPVASQFGGGMDSGMPPKKPKPAPLNDDLKFIKCETCQKMVAEVYSKVSTIVEGTPAARAAKRRFDADPEAGGATSKVEDLLTKICNADANGKDGATSEGVWMAGLDIQKRGQLLKLVPSGPGHCRRECHTIAKACDDVLGILSDGDADLAEVLLLAVKAKQSEGMVIQRVCTKMAKVCKKGNVPLWPEGRPRKNEQFKAKTQKELQLEQLLAGMKGSNGAGVSAMSPNEMDLGLEDRIDPIDVLKEEL